MNPYGMDDTTAAWGEVQNNKTHTNQGAQEQQLNSTIWNETKAVPIECNDEFQLEVQLEEEEEQREEESQENKNFSLSDELEREKSEPIFKDPNLSEGISTNFYNSTETWNNQPVMDINFNPFNEGETKKFNEMEQEDISFDKEGVIEEEIKEERVISNTFVKKDLSIENKIEYEISSKNEVETDFEKEKEEVKPKKGLNLSSWLSFSLKKPSSTKLDETSATNTHANSHHFRTLDPNAPKIQVNNQHKKLHELETECLVHILSFLSVESLLNLKQVNRRFKYLVELDRVWALRLKCIDFTRITWNDEVQNEIKPELIIKKLWQLYGKEYLQFRYIDKPNVYLTTFQLDDSPDRLAKVSKRVYQLLSLSKAKLVDDWSEINHNLLIMREFYEAALLNNLNIAYSEMDMEELKVQCLALQGLEGSNLGIKWLVEQNPIFIYHDYKSPETVDDLEMIYDMMSNYYNSLKKEILLENELLLKIFDHSKEGNTTFLEQLFRDCIPGFLIPILSTALEQSDMQPSLYTSILVKALELGKQLIFELQNEELIEFHHLRVETSFYYLFRPHLDTFFKTEYQFLDLNYSTLTKNFLYTQFGTLSIEDEVNGNSFLNNLMNNQKKVFNSMTKAFKNPNLFQFNKNKNDKPINQSNNFEESDEDETVLESNQNYQFNNEKLNNNNNNSNNNSNNNNNNLKNNLNDNNNSFNFASFISIELSQSLIKLNNESLTRVSKFLYFKKYNYCNNLVNNSIEQIFIRLTLYLNHHHLNQSFEAAFKKLRQHQSEQFQSLEEGELVEPVLSFFDMIKKADLIHLNLDQYYNEKIIQYIDYQDFLNPINIAKKKFETSIDEVVALGLDLSIQTLMHHVHTLLQHYQLITDFKPIKPLDHLRPTRACQAVVNCLIAHVNLVRKGNLDAKILEVFYTEIALRLFNDLTKHIKQYQISEAGGYQLLSDLTGYYSWVATLDIPKVIPHFQALKEVANIFLLKPENLRILLHDQERFLGIFHPEELLEFVQKRPDYKKIQKIVEVEGCLVM